MYDCTWHRGRSKLAFWYEDDIEREKWWRKAHWLYVTRRDLPESSPYGMTLQDVMDAMRLTWFHENANEGDLFITNAEQHALHWTAGALKEWNWFARLVRNASMRNPSWESMIEWYNIHDEQYQSIHAHTQGTIAIVSLHPSRWLQQNFDRLTRSQMPHKIALITPTKTRNAQVEEMLDMIETIPGCDVGLWTPAYEIPKAELQHVQEVAETIERRLGYRDDATPVTGADGEVVV